MSERTISGNRKDVHITDSQFLLCQALGAIGVSYKSGHESFPRYGEYSKEGKIKTYEPDIRAGTSMMVIVEVQGKGSASRDNPDRDRYWVERGFWLVKVENSDVEHNRTLVAAYVKAVCELYEVTKAAIGKDPLGRVGYDGL